MEIFMNVVLYGCCKLFGLLVGFSSAQEIHFVYGFVTCSDIRRYIAFQKYREYCGDEIAKK